MEWLKWLYIDGFRSVLQELSVRNYMKCVRYLGKVAVRVYMYLQHTSVILRWKH